MNRPVDSQSVVVKPLEGRFLDAVVRIHQETLSYTLNSRLGSRHLATVYENLDRQDGSYVGVAVLQGRPVGVVSGTLDADRAKSKVLRSIALQNWLTVIWKLALNPLLLREWWKGNVIARPVYLAGQQVRAVLTALAVDPGCQRSGIGRQLVEALETYFTQHGVRTYRLDTLISNQSSREFYKRLGFTEAGIRADSIVLIKQIAHTGTPPSSES